MPDPASTAAGSAVTGPRSARIFGLDALRAAAILSVTFAHFFAVLYPHVFWLGVFGHGGFVGVELFFVLSGFLIGQILIRSGAGLGTGGALPEFYVRRWFRTLPLFWLLLLGNIALDAWQGSAHPTVNEVLSHAFFLRNFASPRITLVPEAWSLAVEEWFYLLFPAALWLGLRLRARFDAVFLTAAIGFYVFSTWMRWNTSAMPEAEWNWQRITVINRFDALMVGVIAAWLSLRFPAVWQRSAWAAALAGVVLVFGTYVTLWRVEGNWVTNAHDSIYARVWRFNLVSLGFALLLPLASGWKVAAENFASMAVRRIALWSYAIYLVQHPVSRWIMPRFFPDWQRSASSAWCLFSLLLLVTVAVSALLHHAFEAPCTRLRERAGPVIRRFFAAA